MDNVDMVTMPTKKVLLVHGDPNIREVMLECLSQLGGWQVVTAHSPAQGLRFAVQHQPDAIVLDLSASGMDYLTFLQKLNTQSPTQSIPIVVLTAGAKWLDLQCLQTFQVVGAIDYSCQPQALTDKIATLLNWGQGSQDRLNSQTLDPGFDFE